MPYIADATPDINDLSGRFYRIRNRHAFRDTRTAQVMAVREGRMNEVSPELFPQSGPWQAPIVANMIDIAARDIAEMLAPLPAFNCASTTMVSDRDRNKASMRTKIAGAYVAHSNLQVQMYTGTDRYATAGFLPIKVEPDWDNSMPVIRCIDPVGSYIEKDRFGNVIALFQRVMLSLDELVAQYPELTNRLLNGRRGGEDLIEVVFYHDKNVDAAFLAGGNDKFVLSSSENLVGKVCVVDASRPGATTIPRGQFDDVLFVQLARSRFALLALQAAHESVNAPLVVPNDVLDVEFGPGAIIQTNNPQGVGRVNIEIPQAAFAEQASLERELQLGSRFPEVRTGNTDSAIVTGKGVQALMGGYESQIRGHQAVFARALSEAVSIAFEMDEKLWPNVEKSMRGSANGTPYEITYTPAKHIKGEYTVETRYGLMAGLDPNRWLVFGLQGMSAGLFSKDFMMREMPMDIDVSEERQKIDIEKLEEAAMQSLMGYAQSIPVLASQGQDPAGPINALAKVIEGRRKGKALADLIVEAFTPEPEPAPEEQMGMPGQPQDPNAPQGGLVPGLGPTGLLKGVAAGQAGMAPGGRPDLNMMLAGLDARGNANLTASISKREAV